MLKKINEMFNDTEKKKLKPLIFLAVICVLALIVISVMPDGKKEEANVSTDPEVKTSASEKEQKDLESKLTQILSKINGAGDVDVMITFQSSEEVVPAYNSNTTTETTKEQDSSGGA